MNIEQLEKPKKYQQNVASRSRGQTNLILQKWVTVSLLFVFVFSVLATYTVIFLLGLELIKLPLIIVNTLLTATIAKGAVLYYRVISTLFPVTVSDQLRDKDS